ncbi:MAG: hypothetical protein R3F53_17800 [Gammaproteobacteria bacterium]
MFAESIDMTDVVLEGLKALTTLVLVVVLSRAGKRYPQLSGGAWGMIIFGFVLMFIGFLFDFSDEIINYDASDIASKAESLIEEASLIIGLIMVTVGFSKWFNFVGRMMGLKAGG